MPNTLSVQLYSVREQLPEHREGVLRRISEIGYGAVEPFQPTLDPRGLRALADDLGLAVPSLHARALVDGDADAALDAAAILGAELVIVPAGIPPEQFASTDGIARAAETLNVLAERAATRDLTLGYHNHWWEIEAEVDGVYALEALAARLEPEVFLELDVYWAVVAGADATALIGRLGDRVRALHLKDGPGVAGQPQTALGRGVLPLAEILAAAPDALRVVEIDDCAGSVLDALAESHDHLLAIG